jgi:Uma2 family endonuclease
MIQTAVADETLPLHLRLNSKLRLSDEELFELCRLNTDVRIERTAQGDLEIMPPVGAEGSYRNSELIFALVGWAKRDGRGLVFDSSGGFILPDGAKRSPDAAWVLRSRLEGLDPGTKKRFLPLCPDFVVELRSPSDALGTLQAKMQEYLDNGARLGWLIDADHRRVYVYRPGRSVEELEDPETISAEPELPGFVLDPQTLWASI